MWTPDRLRKNLKKIPTFRGARDGVAMIEFSMVALPFFFLLFVILETGYFFLLSTLLEGAAAEGARQIRTGVVQQGATPEDNLQNLRVRVCGKVYLIACDKLVFDVRNFDDFASATAPPDIEDPEDAIFEPVFPGSTVIVRVIYKWTFITPFIEGVVDVKQMISTVAFRNEPY